MRDYYNHYDCFYYCNHDNDHDDLHHNHKTWCSSMPLLR